jgi:CxxC motif-containing protein (DUF1111 family)
LLAGFGVLVIGACGGSQHAPSQPPDVSGPPTTYALGEPLARLTSEERQAFEDGLEAFQEAEEPEEGLGPVFNGRSCAECHQAGAIGGSGTNIGIARVTRIGGLRGGAYSDLEDLGGPVLQARSLRELIVDYYCEGEVVPAGAQFVSRRITTPLFGAGLIEAIPEQTIVALSRQSPGDGVHGTPNYVTNPENGQRELGRFGWKAQVSRLHVFSGDAYLNEMGITSEFFRNENKPQGVDIPEGADAAEDPEDEDGDVEAFTAFMRFLSPPSPQNPTSPQFALGRSLFQQVKCTSCHIPELRTGPNATVALSNQAVGLYSDLLLHHMGGGLADGIRQGQAQGDQFKTAPLWGLSSRSFFLHDGRATTIEEAILQHGGEASAARDRFSRLSDANNAVLVAFLKSL